jgi:hypothetical protein
VSALPDVDLRSGNDREAVGPEDAALAGVGAEEVLVDKCSVRASPSSPTRLAIFTIRTTDRGSKAKCLEIFGWVWVSILFNRVSPCRGYPH